MNIIFPFASLVLVWFLGAWLAWMHWTRQNGSFFFFFFVGVFFFFVVFCFIVSFVVFFHTKCFFFFFFFGRVILQFSDSHFLILGFLIFFFSSLYPHITVPPSPPPQLRYIILFISLSILIPYSFFLFHILRKKTRIGVRVFAVRYNSRFFTG